MEVNYNKIVSDLLRCGKMDLPQWEKQKFVTICMEDYNVSRETAEKVYTTYHEAINIRFSENAS